MMPLIDNEELTKQISILPDELMINIFKLLPLETILQCENVCSHWRKLARDAAVWRKIVFRYSKKQDQSEVSERNLELLKTHHDYIRCLKIQYVNSYPMIKSIIHQCPNLISLELVMCHINKDLEEDIAKWPNLRKLNLKNSVLLVPSNVEISYNNFKYLKYLALSDFGLPPQTRNTLLNCKHLTHIFIEKIRSLDLEFVHDLIRMKMEIIQALHIFGGDAVNDESLYLISQCKMLKDLAVIHCETLTDAGLIKLTNLKRIQHLQIWNNSNFTEVNLRRTLGCPTLFNLKSLSLSKISNISPMIVDVISEYYKNLTFLAVYQCPRIINTDYEKQLNLKFRNIGVVLY